jgi:hypothetical protein
MFNCLTASQQPVAVYKLILALACLANTKGRNDSQSTSKRIISKVIAVTATKRNHSRFVNSTAPLNNRFISGVIISPEHLLAI